MLSVITMAGESKSLSYDKLMKELDINNKQDLEELLLELIYNRLINATLDEKYKVVHVEWTFGRDAKAEDIDEMVQKLENWVDKMEKVEDHIEKQIHDLDNNLTDARNEKSKFIQQCMETTEEEKKGGKGKSSKIGSMLSNIQGKFFK